MTDVATLSIPARLKAIRAALGIAQASSDRQKRTHAIVEALKHLDAVERDIKAIMESA